MTTNEQRCYRVATWAVAACSLAFLLWMVLGLGGERVTVAVDDIGELLAAAAAAAACGWRARRSPPGQHRHWALLAASAAAWAAGETVWTWYEVVDGRDVPFPSLADAGFLLAVPLAVAGLLAFPTAPAAATTRLKALLDGALVAAGLLFVSWATVLGPLYRRHEGTLVEQVFSLAYPVGDVVTVAVVFVLGARTSRSSRATVALVGSGLLAIAVADSAFAYLTAAGSFGSGNLLDTGWVVGYLLIALAALRPGQLESRQAADRPQRRLGLLLPYLPVLAALGVAVAMGMHDVERDGVLAVTGLAALVVLGVRQFVAVRENVSLSERLAAKVEQRGAELRQREARFAALVQKSSDAIGMVGLDGTISYQSPSMAQLLGWGAEELVDRNFLDLLHPDDLPTWRAALAQVSDQPGADTVVEWRLVRRDGEPVHVETRVTNLLHDENLEALVLNSRDVGERKELENQLRHQAFHDPLTGLANRALFHDRLEHALTRRALPQENVAVLFLDLDDFKSVNDGLGHAVGDEVLRAVAARVLQYVRTADTVARLGGDEFAVLVDGIAPGVEVAGTAGRILAAFEEPFDIGGTDVFIHASIGLAKMESGTETAGDLLRNADVAMYAAKAAGKARCEVFHSDLHDAVISRMQLETDLRGAVNRDEFVIHYQPIVDVATGEIVGAEGLLRWAHPHRGLVPPDAFIPAAELTGLIVPIGEWVLREACRQAATWPESPDRPPLRLSLNLSGRQLEDANLPVKVQRILRETGLDPSRLTLEITETTVIADPDRTIPLLHMLKRLGVSIAMDDFGMGYSSLSYLHRLPIDELKIDREFVAGLTAEGEDSVSLVRTILRMAEDFRMDTVAEGIEEAGQVRELSRLGCHLAQGFYFSRPVPEAEFRTLVQSGGCLRSALAGH